MKTIEDYCYEQASYADHVREFITRYECEDPESHGDQALGERMAIGREAYVMLDSDDFHHFFRAVVIVDPMHYRPEICNGKCRKGGSRPTG